MLKRLTLILLAVVLFSAGASAQAKVQNVVTSEYNRNSVSFVAVQRGDTYDSTVNSVVTGFNPGQKFDINKIQTGTVSVRKARSESLYRSEIDAAVAGIPFGREILASIFNRDASGMMDDNIVRYRGNYDAKDQDVINARASRVGVEALGDMGHRLVGSSYLIAIDFYGVKSEKDKKGNVTWSTSAVAYAYKIGMSMDSLNDFYEKCWIYEDDSPAVREAKRRAFSEFPVDMNPVASSSNSASGKKNPASAMSACLSGLITGLENSIDEWEVAVAISARKPLRAKIGTKEGLKNGDRYRAYSYTEDASGRLVSVPRGFIRATEISDNIGMAMGETEPSEFYQISGIANVDEGWTIKQSNDLRIGASAAVRLGGFCSGASLMFDFDYIMDVKTNGTMQYLLANLGFDLASLGVSNVQIGAGYAYAWHLSRFFEVAPYGAVILDHLSPFSSFSSSESEYTFLERSAFALEPGVRATFSMAYPLQIYAKAFYDLLLQTGSYYRDYNNGMGAQKHKNDLGFQFGVKWTF